jgi:hypothetical protein
VLKNPEFQRIVSSEMKTAERKLGHAYQALEKGRPDRAIKSLGKACEHARMASSLAALRLEIFPPKRHPKILLERLSNLGASRSPIGGAVLFPYLAPVFIPDFTRCPN